MNNRARNSLRGRKAQQVGARFEDWVEEQHELAKQLGILACDHHNEPKVKFVKGQLIYDEATVADWTGTLEGGRSLAVEAKSVEGWRFGRNNVTKLQQEHLETVARAKGAALLVVEFRVTPAEMGLCGNDQLLLVKWRYAIPWLEVPWSTKRSAEAVYLDELQLTNWQVVQPCYLSLWHPGGPRSTPLKQRVYPSE